MIKELTLYHIERVDSQTSNEGWLMVGDVTGTGLSNVNLDWKLFVIGTLQSYYPRGLKYIIAPNLPLILDATAQVVIAFANPEFRNRIKLISKEELREIIDDQQIPENIKVKQGENIATKLIGSLLG